MAELQAARVQLVVGQGVEHEGVVGVGAVADGDQSLGHWLLTSVRNARVASCRGSPKTCSGGPDSATVPLCMTWTVWATLRAKPIAWVTTSMVWPVCARSVMTPSTSAAMRG